MVTETRQSKRMRRVSLDICSEVNLTTTGCKKAKVNRNPDKGLFGQKVKVDNADQLSTDGMYGLSDEDMVPQGFYCPLTMEVMFDPVLDIDGNTYERSAVTEWLLNHRTSPVSRQPLSAKLLIPNNALRDTIHEFMGEEWVRKQQSNLPCQKPTVDDNKNSGSPVANLSTTPLAVNVTQVSDVLGENGTVVSRSTTGSSNTYRQLRHRIDCYLQSLSRELFRHGDDTNTRCLSLSEQGLCAFRYEDMTIVLDVPDQVGFFCLFTKNLVPGMSERNSSMMYTTEQRNAMYHRAMQLNFLQGGTRGGCLSITPSGKNFTEDSVEEITFSYTDRIIEVTASDFSNIILNFVETCVDLRKQLLLASVLPSVTSLLMQSTEEAHQRI